jgi:hypothetical protein
MRLSLEEMVSADKELEGWENDRLQQSSGGNPMPPGGP